ncbi:hypothetical protein TcCL_ESM08050 [Trypanosoma cruzi]|nr:hypothetical protein TcCL_ESM08050 [Trypanosoma cruzi]
MRPSASSAHAPILNSASTQTVVRVYMSVTETRSTWRMWEASRSTQQVSGSKQSKNDHHNYSYFIHRTTVEVHMSPWLSAGTHSPRSLLAHSGARQRGCGEQQRGTHPRRAAEAAVDFTKM